ncbi:hypothetical protein [Streptomyces prasinopilosus]|uniref:Uncharacterized protein n=1 Tax=Streptomyces prasinopilosus TaxID=67344 RepID=A0A1G6ZL65_9ACTN|nr:hypothetical protein [Streptomyces prasinopilosus]SDE03389.1 hypothetical protein SAMN05216505_11572 [Streptomyces prasinopilosus]
MRLRTSLHEDITEGRPRAAAVTAAALATGMPAVVNPAPAEAAATDTDARYAPAGRDGGKAPDVSGASTADGAGRPVDAP